MVIGQIDHGLSPLVVAGVAGGLTLFLFFLWRTWNKESVLSVEQNLFLEHPFSMVGKPDMVTRRRNHLIIYDRKLRKAAEVRMSDRVQLTCYMWLAEEKWKLPVKSIYVTTNNAQVRVKPLKRKEIIRIYRRWEQLQTSPGSAVKTDDLTHCGSCQFFRRRCSGADVKLK